MEGHEQADVDFIRRVAEILGEVNVPDEAAEGWVAPEVEEGIVDMDGRDVDDVLGADHEEALSRAVDRSRKRR